VVKALPGAKGQEQLAKRGLAQPSRVGVAQSAFWAQDTTRPLNKKMLNEAVKYAVFSPFDSRWREIQEKILMPRLDLVFNGKKTAGEVIEEVVPEMNAALQKPDN